MVIFSNSDNFYYTEIKSKMEDWGIKKKDIKFVELDRIKHGEMLKIALHVIT